MLRSFYRAIVAMGHLPPNANPMAGFPTIKAVPRKLPVSLSPEQVSRLLGVRTNLRRKRWEESPHTQPNYTAVTALLDRGSGPA